jgi:hypothetical protein
VHGPAVRSVIERAIQNPKDREFLQRPGLAGTATLTSTNVSSVCCNRAADICAHIWRKSVHKLFPSAAIAFYMNSKPHHSGGPLSAV